MRTIFASSGLKDAFNRIQQKDPAAQAEIDSDAVGQLAGLKSGGIIKQATLVGALLFTIRSVTEGVLFMGGDSSHMMPAAIQGAIAVVCLVAFLFL